MTEHSCRPKVSKASPMQSWTTENYFSRNVSYQKKFRKFHDESFQPTKDFHTRKVWTSLTDWNFLSSAAEIISNFFHAQTSRIFQRNICGRVKISQTWTWTTNKDLLSQKYNSTFFAWVDFHEFKPQLKSLSSNFQTFKLPRPESFESSTEKFLKSNIFKRFGKFDD